MGPGGFVSLIALTASPDLIDQVHDRLLAAIVDGTLAPGERVTQESVAAAPRRLAPAC